MESNQILIYFIFGVSLLPKIYSDIFSPLILMKKPNTEYSVADQFQNVEGENSVPRFTIPEDYQLYKACPEEKAPLHATYALKVEESVPDFQTQDWEQFIKGILPGLKCDKPIKPIALKIKIGLFDIITTDAFVIGFLIHETNANFRDLWKEYEDLPKEREYDFIPFIRIKVYKSMKSIISEEHQIFSKGLLKPDSVSVFHQSQSYEKNLSFYGSDVDLLYADENQSYMFESIFGESFADYYNPPNKMLRKTQLAPYEDFVLNTWKLTSFNDLNTVPIWTQLHPQLRKIETFLRKVARELEKLTIKTGTNRVLHLTGVNNKEHPIYLHKKKTHPAPRFLWKLVRFKPLLDDDFFTQAILIVMHNDPYTPDQTPICDDVSESLGWMVANERYETGLTYVCKVDWLINEKLLDEHYNEYTRIFNLKKVVVKLRDVGNGNYESFTENIYAKIMQSS